MPESSRVTEVFGRVNLPSLRSLYIEDPSPKDSFKEPVMGSIRDIVRCVPPLKEFAWENELPPVPYRADGSYFLSDDHLTALSMHHAQTLQNRPLFFV